MSNLSDSGLLTQANERFDEALDAVATAVASAGSQRVRGVLDELKAAVHQLLEAHRLQLRDDLQSLLLRGGIATQQRLEALEQWAYGSRAVGNAIDDPTGSDAGAHPRG